jgi:hypothetical protein
MSERLSSFSVQIAVALFGIVCCGPSAQAQTITPCYRPTVATAASGQTFNGKLCTGKWGCACTVVFCPVCNSAGSWAASCSFTTCRALPPPRK